MKTQTNTGYIVFLSVVAAIGGILFGYDTAVISGTIAGVATQFGLDAMQQGWFVGCALVGSIAGVAVAGVMSDRFGRKRTMLVSAVLFTVSAVGCALCADFQQLILYRIIGGVGIGVVSIVSPMYISEVAVARWRGSLVSLYQLAITVGFLAAYLVNFGILRSAETAHYASETMQRIWITERWRGMFGAETLPAALFFLVLFFIPESPRWLLLRGSDERARTVLSRIYPARHDAEQEIAAVRATFRKSDEPQWRALLEPGIRRAVAIGAFIAILGQFMGVNAVLYYGPTIFENAGLSSGDSLFSQVLVGTVNMLTTVLALAIIDRVGRKQLVYWGVSGMILSLIGIGVYFLFGTAWGLPNAFLLVFFLFYCLLLRRVDLRRGLRTALGDVSHAGARHSHVDRRAFALGGHLPDRTAHPVDARKPDAGRHVLPLRGDVHPLHRHHVARRARNDGPVARRDRKILDELITKHTDKHEFPTTG